jgi:hypothetical protein
VNPRSWRWWFEHRETGEITIAQFPNWPLWAIGACWLARLVTADGSTAHDLLGWAIRGLWLVWGTDELVRGVNPWRRVLGAGVIVWQIVAVATM